MVQFSNLRIESRIRSPDVLVAGWRDEEDRAPARHDGHLVAAEELLLADEQAGRADPSEELVSRDEHGIFRNERLRKTLHTYTVT